MILYGILLYTKNGEMMKPNLFEPNFSLDELSITPLREQLVQQVKNSVTYLRPLPGTKIISERKVALNCQINRKTVHQAYEQLIALGLPAEDARSVLPQACCSNIVVSMNIRSFMHFCNERLCTFAQLEIRQMAQEMAKQAGELLPFLKPYFVPKCEMLGYCNESAKRSCHRRPTFDELTGKKD